MEVAKNYFYAVKYGRETGVFMRWEDCKAQINGYVGARFKKFYARQDAEDYVQPVVAVAATSSSSVKVKRHAHTPKNESFIEISNASGGNTRNGDFGDVPTDIEEDYFADPFPFAFRTLPVKAGKGEHKSEDRAFATPSKQYEDLVVYCDGACRHDGSGQPVAGIGVWWGDNDKRNMCERCPGLQTNNCAELVAIVRVLEKTSIDKKRKLVIKSDSQYAINCLTVWIKNWNKTGNPWRKKNGDPVLNSELISYAYALIESRKMLGQMVELVYVKGHAGSEGNEAADKLASLGANLKDKKVRDWAAKEEKYRCDAAKTRLEIESGEFYLRREDSVRIDVIETSQEERELGGFRMKTSRPTKTVAGVARSSQLYGEKEGSASQFVYRPVGPSLQYRSDQSTQSVSSSPKTCLSTEKMDALSLDNRADVQEEFSDAQVSDLEAYAQCLADSDDLEDELSD